MHQARSTLVHAKHDRPRPTSDHFYPEVGIGAVVVGTVLAIALLPQSDAGGENLVGPSIAMSVGLMTAPVLAALRDLRSLLRLEHILPLALVYWLLLDQLQGDTFYPGVTSEDIVYGYVAIGVFAIGGFASGLIARPQPPHIFMRSATSDLSPSVLFRVALLCFGLGIFKFAYAVGFNPIQMIVYAGAGRWAAPWGAARLGGWSAVLDHMVYFGYLVPVLTVTLASKVGWLKPRTLLLILCSVLLLILLAQGGGRRVVGVMAGAPLVTWVLAQARIDLGRLIIIGFWLAAVLTFLEVMLEYRNRGLATFFEDSQASLQVERINVDDNFYRLAQTIQIVPKRHNYVYHQQLVYTLVRPIPRALWPGKPVNGGFDLAQFLGTTWLTLSSTVVAEFYISGGLFVVFLGGVLYGLYARTLGWLWTVTHSGVGRLLYGVSVMALFAGVRSMVDLVLMSYILLAWLVVWWFLVRRNSQQSIRAQVAKSVYE